MDVSHLIRLRLGAHPEQLPGTDLPDPHEVDRICTDLRWPDEYAATWMAHAAGLPANDPDGKPMRWTRRQIRFLLLVRHLHATGRLTS